MSDIKVVDIKNSQIRRRDGRETATTMQLLNEIDVLLKRVEMLEDKFAMIHTDKLLEQYKSFAATLEGQEELLKE